MASQPSPAPLIILCPMRSFSSVVCGMLGRHPETYGFPELNLFVADRVDAWFEIYRKRTHGTHGLLRALAELHHGEQTEERVREALAWLEARRDWTTKAVFDHLLEAVSPRVGIDKSPRTVLQPEYLERAFAMYPDASFLHLTRHPRSTGRSLLANIERNAEWGGNVRTEWVDPEKIWLRAHGNIVALTSALPIGQSMRIRGEDLISEPELYLAQIAEWLGLDSSPAAIEAMLHPEQSPYAVPGPDNARLGNDPDFLESPGLRRGRVGIPPLAGPLEWAPEREFSKETRKLAKEMGYA